MNRSVRTEHPSVVTRALGSSTGGRVAGTQALEVATADRSLLTRFGYGLTVDPGAGTGGSAHRGPFAAQPDPG